MIVGVSGLIGSGKSYVCTLLQNRYGARIFDSDSEAKEIMDNDEYVHRKICLHFGMESYVDGKLNTAYLSDIVFNDKDKLAVLENIVHPRVFLKFREIAKCSCMDQMLVLESAILFDVGWNKFCDKVIWVDAGFHVRKKRVMDRDGISFEDVKGKFFSQANGKVYVADHVVDNNNDSRYIDLSFMEKYV